MFANCFCSAVSCSGFHYLYITRFAANTFYIILHCNVLFALERKSQVKCRVNEGAVRNWESCIEKREGKTKTEDDNKF